MGPRCQGRYCRCGVYGKQMYSVQHRARERPMPKPKRAALYLRVSTDGQSVENQRSDLAKLAELRAWEVVATYQDAGVSGSKGRDKRPGLDALLKDAQRRRFDVAVFRAVDRLGRST